MVEYVSQFAKIGKEELTIDERNILSVAFKNVVGTRRAAWRVITLIERKENKKGTKQNAEKAKNYTQKIEKELTEVCQKILDLLNALLTDLADVNKTVDIIVKLDERTVTSDSGYLTLDHVAQTVQPVNIFPRILS